MKRIQLMTPTGRIATLDVDIEKFKGLPVEVFLTEYVDRYDRAFSTISRQRIIDALRELWELEYLSEKPEDAADPEDDQETGATAEDDPEEGPNPEPDTKPAKKSRKAAE